jgi:hypothetical protein
VKAAPFTRRIDCLRPVKKQAAGFFTELVDQVRLGICAPREVVIDRAEVHQRKLVEYTADKRASKTDSSSGHHPNHPHPLTT